MNRIKRFASFTFAFVCAAAIAALSACNGDKLLFKPAEQLEFTSAENSNEGYVGIRDSAEKFAAEFAEAVISSSPLSEGNIVLSPISVYAALALSAQCAAGNTRREILDAMHTDNAALTAGFNDLYRSVLHEDGRALSLLTNSVWIDDDVAPYRECLKSLAEEFGCWSYSADFDGDNAGANRAIRKFVKDNTRGLIDRDFMLDENTYFALINTLYLKDYWYYDGSDLELTDRGYTFTHADGSSESVRLMEGEYLGIAAYDGGEFTSCYTQTNSGYKLYFVLPEEGYAAEDVFTAENISKVLSAEYRTDAEEGARRVTRCLFPAFEAEFCGDVIEQLRQLCITDLFKEGRCDLSAMLGEESDGVYCRQVTHAAKLKADRKGIEGAAVTVASDGATSAEPPEVMLDFVVDGTFGFILCNRYGTTLFSGVIDDIS